jgi:hypothetical protein
MAPRSDTTRRRTPSSLVSKRLRKAHNSIPSCPGDVQQLDVLYPRAKLIKQFGNGKSGAIVILIQHDGVDKIVKFYMDAYKPVRSQVNRHTSTSKERYQTNNNRPLTEVLTSQCLSGTVGYPSVERVLCTYIPPSWKAHFKITNTISHPTLATVVSAAPGVCLNELPLHGVSEKDRFAIVFRILHIMECGFKKLGRSFRHTDLHPGNIIIDCNKRVRTVLKWQDDLLRHRKVTFEGPGVTIIDFDLSHVNIPVFNALTETTTLTAGRRIVKTLRKSVKPVDMVTLKFFTKHVRSYQRLANVVYTLMKTPSNSDARNWYCIACTLLNKTAHDQGLQLRLGATVSDCVQQNAPFLEIGDSLQQ